MTCYCFSFSLLLSFFLITLNGSVDYTNLKTCVSAILKLNPCDWERETFLWHVTKICPGEWVIKGFWEGTVSKNEYQHERTQSRQRFSGSPRPGSYSQWQRFKHCFAWLYLWNDAFIWANRIYLVYVKYIPGLCQICCSCHAHLVVECYIMRHNVSVNAIQISGNVGKIIFLGLTSEPVTNTVSKTTNSFECLYFYGSPSLNTSECSYLSAPVYTRGSYVAAVR